MEDIDLATSVIEPSKVDGKNDDAIKVATIHRVKGLVFDQLILASANEGSLRCLKTGKAVPGSP
jgi:superfamily I DNA/RNA helicase